VKASGGELGDPTLGEAVGEVARLGGLMMSMAEKTGEFEGSDFPELIYDDCKKITSIRINNNLRQHYSH
jgi:hypothetical protein